MLIPRIVFWSKVRDVCDSCTD